MLDSHIPLSSVRNYIDRAGVYEIVCEETGRVYIGQSTSVTRRVLQHLDDLEADRHSNKLLQHDWNLAPRPDFGFRLVLEIPYTNVSELIRQERTEIERRRNFGVMLYNDFRAVGARGVSEQQVSGDPLVPETPTVMEDGSPKSGHDQGNKPYQRPSHKSGTSEIVACYDCGTTGEMYAQMFRCNDEQIRCESCIDKYLGSLTLWLERQEKQADRVGKWRRRWHMGSQNIGRELVLAMASYTQRFKVRPQLAYVHSDCPIPEDVALEVRHDRVTPFGYIDLPMPEQG
jgi:hypothetical protein